MTDATLLARVRASVEAMGFELVDLRQRGARQRPILDVRVDRPGSTPGHGITADECGALSRELERMLEGEGHVGPRYVLEVSSPGIERPLRFAPHWAQAVGRRARVKAAGLAGRPEVEVLGVEGEEAVRLRLPDGTERRVALADVVEAHLVVDWQAIVKARRPGAGRTDDTRGP